MTKRYKRYIQSLNFNWVQRGGAGKIGTKRLKTGGEEAHGMILMQGPEQAIVYKCSIRKE